MLGDPIVIGYGSIATTLDGMSWADLGDQLIVAARGVSAVVEVTSVLSDGNPCVWCVSGELELGDVRVMRAPTLPLDRRALVRAARLVRGGAS